MGIPKIILRWNVFSRIDRMLGSQGSTQSNVIIYGFWRSGTTFMMEQVAQLTESRSYFEPLLLKTPKTWPDKYRRHNSPELHRHTIPVELKDHPCYYINPQENNSQVDSFLKDVFTGKISSRWTRKSRLLRYSLRPGITLKLVRGNLLAAYCSKKFGGNSIFVLRHPCGIIASTIRKQKHRSSKGGIETGLISASFIESLLNQDTLVNDHLAPFVEDIQKWNTSDFNRIILAWAINNYVPLQQMKTGVFRPQYILYERFVLDAGYRRDMMAYLGVDNADTALDKNIQSNSATVQGNRKSIAPIKRLFSWREELSDDEIKTVYDICSCFGPVLMGPIEAIDDLADPVLGEISQP